MRSVISRSGSILLLGLVAALAAACVSDVGDIDRTDPDKLRKADFKGHWYYATTVIEAPAPSPVTFNGEMAYFPGPTKVLFDIQEDYLVVYPTRPLHLEGADEGWHKKKIRNYWDEGKAEEFVEMDLGSPVAAFKIDNHFDVIRQYNAQTGEQSNVIVENSSDRKWYEREYMRVNWSSNVIKDLMFLAGVNSSPVDYYVPEYEIDNPDAFEMTEDSINFVTKMFLDPSTPESCSVYMLAPADCVGVVAKLRHSFKQVDPNNDYVPLFYDQFKWMEKFGFFLTERYGYDEDHGLVHSAKQYLIQRWNLWDNSRTAQAINNDAGLPVPCRQDSDCEGLHAGQVHCWVEDGWFSQGHCVTWDPTPIHERTPRPIRYWISPDWPEELRESPYETADQWNVPFKDTVAWTQFYSEKGLLEVKYCDSHADCTPAGTLLDRTFTGQRPYYCTDATEKADCQDYYMFAQMPHKSYHQCGALGTCVAPTICNASSPCAVGQMCFSDFCHACAAADGNCDPENQADGWAQVEKELTEPGTFTLYYLPDSSSKDAGKKLFLRGVDDAFLGIGSKQTHIAFAHLNPFVGKVKLVAGNESVCKGEDGSDMVFGYVGAETFRTPGCTIELPQDEDGKLIPATWNFTVIDVDSKQAVGVYNFVVMEGQMVHTFALVGDDKKASLLHDVVAQSDISYGGMRLAHGAAGAGAVDYSVGGALVGRGVTFGSFTRFGHLSLVDTRVVLLPAGSPGDITCFQLEGIGQCTGWRPELSQADYDRIAEIKKATPDMYVVCENIYSGDFCTDEERGDKSLLNDCRYWYQDAQGEWHNPCGQVAGAGDLKKHGDIRYSQMYWIPEDQSASPLGYGPSAPDPDTGELHYGIANIYGAPMIGYGQYAKDLLDLSTGKLDKLDVASAKYIMEYLANKEQEEERTGSLYAPLPSPERLDRLRQVRPEVNRFWFTPAEEEKLKQLIQSPEIQEKIFDPKKSSKHLFGSLPPSMGEQQLAARFDRIKGSWLENLMVTEEVKLAANGGLAGSSLSPEQLASLSPTEWAPPYQTRKYEERMAFLAEHGCYYSAEMVEPNIFHTAKQVQQWCADAKNREKHGWNEDECQVWRITRLILDGTLEHEVGHTIGLRHNFSASKDLFNYQEEYYDVREKQYRVCTKEGQWGCPHGDDCKVFCEANDDCMPGTTCEEVTVEGAVKKACVDEHLDVQGWCWGNRTHYVDCVSDADCAGIGGTSRCNRRAEERWGRCQVVAAPEGGICPAGSMPVAERCLTEDYCLVPKGQEQGRCALDGSRNCAKAKEGGEDECSLVWVDKAETAYEPIFALGMRSTQTQAEIEAGRSEYMYSTLMDYGGTINFDIHGIGKWDEAAIRFGYGELMDCYTDTHKIFEEAQDVLKLWGGSVYSGLAGIFLDTSFYNDFYWFSPFYFLTDLLGVKENLERVYAPYRKADLEREMLITADRGFYDLTYRMVSYENSTDMWRGSLETYVWDLGVDLGEIIDHSWNKLQEYYIFDAFKRERWYSYRGANPLGYYNRILARWFPPIEDAGRFYAMFFNSWRGYADLREWMFSSPHFLGRWQIFADDCMTKLAQLMFSPAPGSFKLVDKGTPMERFLNFSYDTGEPGSELNVPLGAGKFPYTTFYGDAGYYYFEHAAFIGSFWEKLAASATITYAMGYFLGDNMGEQVDVGVGSSVGFNNTYYTEITNMLAGFITGNRDHYAPYVEDGELHFYDPLHPWEAAGMPKVDTTNESLAMKAYHGLFGFAFVPSGFDMGFVESLRICLKGNGNCWETATPGPDDFYAVEVEEYADPWTKKIYRARTTNFDPKRINASYDLLVRANELKAEWELEEDGAVKERLAKELAGMRETIDLILTFTELYGELHY